MPSDGPDLGMLLDVVRHLRFQNYETLVMLNEGLKALKKEVPGGIESLEFWFGNPRFVQVDDGFRSVFRDFNHGSKVSSGYDCHTHDLQDTLCEADIPMVFSTFTPKVLDMSLSIKQLQSILENDRHGVGVKLICDGQRLNLVPVRKPDKISFLEVTRMFGVWRVSLPQKFSDKTYWPRGTRILFNL